MTGTHDVPTDQPIDPNLALVSAIKLILSDCSREQQAYVLYRALGVRLVDEESVAGHRGNLRATIGLLEVVENRLEPSHVGGNYPIGTLLGQEILATVREARGKIAHTLARLHLSSPISPRI